MATPQKKSDPKQANDDLSFELRRSINNAYSFVNGAQQVQAFSAITIEDCLDQQIESIEGKGTPTRPNELERIKKIEEEVNSAVAKIKSLPGNYFEVQDPQDNVNTEPEPTE
jgi:hypothetical protein